MILPMQSVVTLSAYFKSEECPRTPPAGSHILRKYHLPQNIFSSWTVHHPWLPRQLFDPALHRNRKYVLALEACFMSAHLLLHRRCHLCKTLSWYRELRALGPHQTLFSRINLKYSLMLMSCFLFLIPCYGKSAGSISTPCARDVCRVLRGLELPGVVTKPQPSSRCRDFGRLDKLNYQLS